MRALGKLTRTPPTIARNREHRRALIAMLATAGHRSADDDGLEDEIVSHAEQTGASQVARNRGVDRK